MALDRIELYTTVAVVAVIVVVMLWMNRQKPAPAATEEPSVDPLLCKFASHEGSVVGETVAIDGENLILKQAGVFKSVPKAAAREVDGEIVLSGPIDWTVALAAGAAWLEAHKGEATSEVGGELTKSEDVRSPALAAFQARQEEE